MIFGNLRLKPGKNGVAYNKKGEYLYDDYYWLSTLTTLW